jgi:hypothetical protein
MQRYYHSLQVNLLNQISSTIHYIGPRNVLDSSKCTPHNPKWNPYISTLSEIIETLGLVN